MITAQALTLLDAFRAAASRSPDAPAITFLDSRLRETAYTYDALWRRTEALAERLAAVRLPPEAPVGILVDSQQDQVLHYLAALTGGLVPAILTPPNRKLDRTYYLETTSAVLTNSGFSAVITDIDGLQCAVRELRPYTFESFGLQTRGSDHEAVSGAAFLQFSSGTTGHRRGVLVSHRAALAQLASYASAIDLSQHDVIVSWLPLYHDMGFIASLNLPLAAGAHVVMMHPLDWVAHPALYVRAVSRHRATLGWHPNFAFAFMAERVTRDEAGDVDLSSLRGLVNCSEPVTRESQDRFCHRFGANGLRADVFWGALAMAETTFAITHGTSSDAGYFDHRRAAGASADSGPFVSVGRPLAGVELTVRDDNGDQLSEREAGELWVKSPFTLTRYYNNPVATEKALVNGWYRTGDLGYRAGQEFYVCGRKKDMLVINGVNIHPEQVEEIVSTAPGAQPGRAAAFAIFDRQVQSDRLTVLVESRDHVAEDPQLVLLIRRLLAAAIQLTSFDVYIVPRGWLIKSSAGKVARSANRAKWLERTGAGTLS